MRIFKYIFMTIFLFAGMISRAESAAEKFLTRDLLQSAKTLQSEKKIYSYFYMEQVYSELETADGRNAYVNRYLAARSSDFWRSEFSNTSSSIYAAGPGLYFAIDPLISKSFGDSFMEVRLPPGTRFINVVQPIPLKKDTLAALVAEGFIQKFQIAVLFPKASGFYRDTLRLMVDPQFVNFRKLTQQIFKTNQIQFVEYNFNSSLGHFCTSHSSSAFVYVGDENTADSANAIIPEAFKNSKLFSTKLDIPNLTDDELNQKAEILKFRSVLEEIENKSTADAKKIISENYTSSQYQAAKDAAYSCQ